MSGRHSMEVFVEPWWLILWDKKSSFQLYSIGHIKYGKLSPNPHAAQSSHTRWLLMKMQLLSSQESAATCFRAEISSVASMIFLHITNPKQSWNWVVSFLLTTSQKSHRLPLCSIHLWTLASSSLVIWQGQVFLTLFSMNNTSEFVLF